MNHFLLIKSSGHDKRGAGLTATESAQSLLKANMWVLWSGTPNKDKFSPGDRIAVYVAGCCRVIATATVKNVEPWRNEHAQKFPLTIAGIPAVYVGLQDVQVFEKPVEVRSLIMKLSFIRSTTKWGAAFMMGVRRLSKADFQTLTESA